MHLIPVWCSLPLSHFLPAPTSPFSIDLIPLFTSFGLVWCPTVFCIWTMFVILGLGPGDSNAGIQLDIMPPRFPESVSYQEINTMWEGFCELPLAPSPELTVMTQGGPIKWLLKVPGCHICILLGRCYLQLLFTSSGSYILLPCFLKVPLYRCRHGVPELMRQSQLSNPVSFCSQVCFTCSC